MSENKPKKIKNMNNNLFNSNDTVKVDSFVTMINNEESYILVVECPGIDKEDLRVNFMINNDLFPIIKIKGQTKTNLKTHEINASITIAFDKKIIPDQNAWILKNGVLYITFRVIDDFYEQEFSSEVQPGIDFGDFF